MDRVKNQFYLGLLFLILPQFVNGQIITDSMMNWVRNPERLFCYLNGVPLGCDDDIDCRGFHIKFKTIKYNKKEARLFVSGVVFDGNIMRSISGVRVFSAERKDSLLVNYSMIDSTHKRAGYKKFPYAMGEFNGSFKAGKGVNLYLLHPSFRLIEYNIEELLSLVDNEK